MISYCVCHEQEEGDGRREKHSFVQAFEHDHALSARKPSAHAAWYAAEQAACRSDRVTTILHYNRARDVTRRTVCMTQTCEL